MKSLKVNYKAVVQDSEEGNRAVTRAYLGRYYVLAVLSFLAIHQNVTWMTFGTVPDESYKAFHLSNEQITILAGNRPMIKGLTTFPLPITDNIATCVLSGLGSVSEQSQILTGIRYLI